DLDQFDELVHVPGLYLIGDERSNAALMIPNKTLQHCDHTSVDMRAQSLIVGKLAAGFDQQPAQVRVKHRVRTTDILLEKVPKAYPHPLCKVSDARVGNEVELERLEPSGVFGRARDLLNE